VLQSFEEVSDDFNVVGLLHDLHQFLAVQLAADHLQQVVQQRRFFFQVEQDAFEQEFLVGDLCDDVEELFV